jgi:outer membrane lipoprotein carrier protein
MRFALLALLAALPAAAKEKSREAEGRSLVQRVQKYYRTAKDFSASFDQLYTYVAFGRTQESKGKVQVKRPGLLRWESEKPEKIIIVLDGKDYWQHSPDDNQVTVKRGFVSDQLSSAFTFLWGKGDLLKEFKARKVARPGDVPGLPPGDAVELVPREPQPSIHKLLFIVGKDGRVLASLVTDSQDNLNRLVFHDVKLNGRLPDSLFRFTPPQGANVSDLK